jgi:hypothetical protein
MTLATDHTEHTEPATGGGALRAAPQTAAGARFFSCLRRAHFAREP